MRVFGYKEVTRRCLEALELKGGDGGACKLLGEIRVRSWRCLRVVVRLSDPKLKTLDKRGIKCIFVGYAKHSKGFRFYVIEPNELVSINFIIESRGAILDENIFSSVPRPSLRIPNGTKYIGGSVVPKEDVRFLAKEAINDEMDSIMGNNTWVLADLPLGCKWIFKRKLKVDKKKRFKLTLEVFRDIFQICPRVPGRDFDALPSEEDIVSFLRELESTQIYGAILPECLTSPAMKESKAYKAYLGYATGAVPPKIARKFKKASPSKTDSNLVPVDEEPVQKGKRVKRPAKKSTTKPAACVIIREAHVETKSKSKEKEKVDVTLRKGIKLLSEVALIEEAQMKEVRKNSLRDFHKTHPSGSSTVG
ncbi:hypothetical protein Tco_0177939 [Tanacetum coccineum]